MLLVKFQMAVRHRVIHPVVDVQRHGGLVPHSGTANVGFVGQNQRRRKGAHRLAGAFVVVADGRDNGGNFLRRKVHSVKDAERHHRAALAVIDPVHNVADIVEISGDLHQLHGSLRIAQRFQNPSGRLSDPCHMLEAVFRKSKGFQRCIRLIDVHPDRFVLFHLFVSHCFPPVVSRRDTFFLYHFCFLFTLSNPCKICYREIVKLLYNHAFFFTSHADCAIL